MKLLKRSPMTVCYICTGARTVALRSLFWGKLFVLSKQTRRDQKFRDFAHDKQRKTVLFRVTLVCLCNDTALVKPVKWKWNLSHIANLTASWYFIKIKYSEPNISVPASVSPLAFAVLLLAVIKQRCITAGAPFWIGGELPVFVVRPHAPNQEVRTVMVRYKYMYHATPSMYVCFFIYLCLYFPPNS